MLRYSTWQAVSTKTQAAADKVSLNVQLEKCLEAGSSHAWRHIHNYTVPGQSRTQYTSLYHAEKNIPQLHDMLEAASRKEFDVLILYDLNRLRSLMRQVFDVLCDYGIQLYVLNEPIEPVAPSHYTEEKKNEMALRIGLRGILSDNEISAIQKHYRDKMPKRITEKGLHAGLGRPPYGYRKPAGKELDHNAILIQVPAQVRVIHLIKELFFDGCSLTEIAARLNKQKIPSPRGRRWWYPMIKYILSNPYYAGIVGFGYTKRIRIRRLGTVQRHKGTPITNKGKHKPIWTEAARLRILAELQRRGQAHPGIKTRQLSRLLHCSDCGAVLWAQTTPAGESWRCSSLQRGHVAIKDDIALERVTAAILHALEHLDDLELPTPTDPRPELNAERRSLIARKQRWMDLYETGATDEDILARLASLNDQLADVDKRLQQTELSLAQSETTRATLKALSVSAATLPRYYRHGPPLQVNTDLHSILARVIVHHDKTITLEWK